MKNNIKLLFLIFSIFSLQMASFGDVFSKQKNLSYIVKKLPEFKNVSCKFSQDKYISSSNIHLKSGGDFKFDKKKGVTFYINYPVKTVVSYTNSEYKQINNIIKSIANKNYKPLENDFQFYFDKLSSNWILGLKPKASSKSKEFLSSIEIYGREDISKIIITTTDKTQTTITFSK